jgi:hypothetical protein
VNVRLSGTSDSLVGSRSRFGDFVLVLFLCAQVLDGAFTYHGISRFGLSEGNPVIAWYMGHFGVGPTVTVAKLVSTGCAIVLHVLAFHKMLALLTLMYLSLAILPWTVVLFVIH